ncbi:hypothetical protein [Formosa maritima]|uniref:Uncharacterized protein n=1 Tax=Formosa maritima TaxID=2592046 RepID=A0A5D0GIU7_9FLAO|nr:hypothetical protein [Formosa maritima]TYA58249.1 hypothetical protein FVF61_03480 [Formosa maritima]
MSGKKKNEAIKDSLNQMSSNEDIKKIRFHKKWKQYFLEFFMLFLAITLGFFAENYREHLSDISKEKEYIHSLIADLKTDQKLLTEHILDIETKSKMMDSLITILNTPSLIPNNSGQLYYFARLGPRLTPLTNNSRTFEQLKNSGNFRLIRNLNTSNKIMTYYKKYSLISLLEKISQDEFNDFKFTASRILDPAILINMEGENGEIIETSKNPDLLNQNPDLLQQLAVFSVYLNGSKTAIINTCQEIKMSGEDLIEYLKNEYKIE